MKREFLENLKIGDQPLSKEAIDAIMAENGRDIEAAKKPYADYESIKQQLSTPASAGRNLVYERRHPIDFCSLRDGDSLALDGRC